MNFVYVGSKRKAGAGEGFTDDAVMALMLAYHGAKLFPHAVRSEPASRPKYSQNPDTIKCWGEFRRRLIYGKPEPVRAPL